MAFDYAFFVGLDRYYVVLSIIKGKALLFCLCFPKTNDGNDFPESNMYHKGTLQFETRYTLLYFSIKLYIFQESDYVI